MVDDSTARYVVSVVGAAARTFAMVRARMPIASVPRTFAALLGKVYEAARGGAIALDGQNIFVYRSAPQGEVDVEFGVGTTRAFEPIGDVCPSETPGGEVATTTHWGDYAGLGGAHAAIVDWCHAQGRALAGPRWEVYGHWDDQPTHRRTDVCYLLRRQGGTGGSTS